MPEQIETVIVGGGQAGLAMSYWLTQHGREHVILEQGRVTERWRSHRWDSLHFLFPRWSMQLPGYAYRGDDPDGFAHRDEVVSFLGSYAATFRAPVQCGVRVREVEHQPDSDRFVVGTDDGSFEARNVVIATGVWQQPVIPTVSADVPGDLVQIHSAAYRNPDQLPPGSILVIDIRAFAGDGVTLLGRVRGIDDGMLQLAANARETLALCDATLVRFTQSVDEYIRQHGLDAPEESLDAVADPPVFDNDGQPVHRRGVTDLPGLYFLGLFWQYKLKSAFLRGVGEDAAYIAEQIVGRR